ncbi:uncharacterized protein LOC116293444 [Actinia tenebrosa]|uniref:Uncharacterized protein LOC116293444 n=1 Tax=Actinia tenebrosa TaxID=6105 RepID=A0A6P8HNW0_ACTTE|nr:uncharacterized protein LOC116293444 [Actinia tenebrosa]
MKQMVVALFFVALCCVAKVQADKCYSCSSIESWDKCNEAKKEITCPSAKCIKLKVSTEIKASGVNTTKTHSYTKGCGSAAACEINNNPLCKISLPGATVSCTVNCCEGDLCNASTFPLVSGIVILTCALVSFLSMF